MINAAVEKAVTAKLDELLGAKKKREPTPVDGEEEKKLSSVEALYN